MFVAPPGQLKTTLLFTLEPHTDGSGYADALCLGDVNIRSLGPIRDQVLGGRYHTLAFGEMEKLYARNPATAANVEAHLKQFVEEGLRQFSHEDPTTAVIPARCLVMAGITNYMFGKMIGVWNATGFARRFLRVQWVMKDENALLAAVHDWKKLTFDMPTVWNGKRSHIPYNLDEKESKYCMTLMRDQRDVLPTILIKRVAVILKVKFPDTWKKILDDIAPALGRNGALLEL
jgi:hypothetical protein